MSAVKRAATDESAKPTKKFKPSAEQYKGKSNGTYNGKSNGAWKDKRSDAAGPDSKLKTLNVTTSREAHQKQKAVARERKLAKPNAEPVQRSKQLWERLRIKSSIKKDERDKLVDELFGIITGHIHDYVFKHDSVRVIQTALKYAKPERRTIIAQELKGSYKVLVESKYGKFLVAKLLVTGNQEVKDMIISELYGRVRQMINHPEASWILDDTYRQVASPKQKASLLREWYGPEFAIFKAPASEEPTADLIKILEANPEKRKPILRYLYDLINQLIQKKMTGFTMLHDAMLQYSLAVGAPADSENATEFIELLKGDEEGDLLKNLAFTKSGARVICRAIAYSGAKDRKLILRVFKDLISDLAHDVNGMHVILAAYEVIDDTVMTSKTVISELLGSKLGTDEERYDFILEEATHLTARIPLLYPLATGSARWLIRPNSDTAAIIEELRTLRTTTSKKEPETRRLELVKALGQNGMLLSTIANRATKLVESSFSCQFVTEVLLGLPEGDKTPAMTAVTELAEGDPTVENHISHSSHAGRMLRTLVAGQKFTDAETTAKADRLPFAEILYPKVKDHLLQWALGENSFVVANYFETEELKTERKDIAKRLKGSAKELQKKSDAGNKGAGLLLPYVK